MTGNEADIIILFVSNQNESFMLLKLGQILTCHSQKLQILIFMVYNAPDVQLTRMKYNNSATEICHEIPWQPFLIQIRILSTFTLLYCNPDALSSILYIRLYVPIDFMHDIFSFIIFQIARIYFPTKITYVTVSFTLPERFVKLQRGIKGFSYVGWSCIRTEQYYQRSIVTPSTFLETIAISMAYAVNVNLTGIWWKCFLDGLSLTHVYVRTMHDVLSELVSELNSQLRHNYEYFPQLQNITLNIWLNHIRHP